MDAARASCPRPALWWATWWTAFSHREKRRAIDWEAGSGEKVVPFESLELRWLVRTEAAAGAVAAALGPVEAVPGQNGAYVTGPVSKAKLDELREKGFSILSAIPVLD